jgi:primosomal protein N' (replication factor Y)
MAKCEPSTPLVFQVAIAVPLDQLFDYLAPPDWIVEGLQPGVRVLVPFRNTHKIGVLLAVRQDTNIATSRLKQLTQILDNEPLLSTQDIALLQWASHYYHHPIGEVLANAFPVALRQGQSATLEQEMRYVLTELGRSTPRENLKRAPKQLALLSLFQATAIPLSLTELASHQSVVKILLEKGLIAPCKTQLTTHKPSQTGALPANPDQEIAIAAIIAALGHFSVLLVEGVTGSGKTEVYMQAIAAVLAKGQQVLVLLPEINLTPQLELRFRQRFSVAIVSSHSKLTDKQRLKAWLSMQQGQATIMLGTRSALFTPLLKPGLIILDEEHDTSFKQQEGFRFSARDVAIFRGKQLNIPVVLGSATPSLESLFNAERKRYQLLTLPQRAGNAQAPSFQVLDIRNKKMQGGLSEQLIAAIHNTLAQEQQVLIFINRRGYAPVQICHACGWVSRCLHCDANLVIHVQENVLRCHHCSAEQVLGKRCPACKIGELQAVGQGTERLEESLSGLFSDKRLVRLDRDTTQRKGSLENYLERINRGEADIILGTQMLAKGHHFPNVTLVAILDIDSGLFSIDYRSGEKLAQMILQVAGRAGRAEKPGKVFLQTRHPQHPLLVTLLSKGYRAFAQALLAERREAQLPPFSFQALIRVHANNMQDPQAFLTAACTLITQYAHGLIKVMGPVAAPMLKRAGQYRFQLLLQSPVRQHLHHLLDTLLPALAKLPEAKKIRWSLDVDPVDLY